MARFFGVLFVLAIYPGTERALGQRAHRLTSSQINSDVNNNVLHVTHCTYPCECDAVELNCDPGITAVRDGCGCCPICPRQIGEPCDKTAVCDESKGMKCRYPFVGAVDGLCEGPAGLSCIVGNTSYAHGETFQVDCRTQCLCQNGTYACSSLCPNENISPRGACSHPRLVEVPNQCCREWMCDSTEAQQPPRCNPEFTSWSLCSTHCGLGFSRRASNMNEDCTLRNETRICQLRPCEIGMLTIEDNARHHHVRKGHQCKATQRVAGPVRLRFGSCRSKKRYRPKFCGSCVEHIGDGCCRPLLSTTIKVDFICDTPLLTNDFSELLSTFLEPGRDLWWPDDLLAVSLNDGSYNETRFEDTDDNFLEFRILLNNTVSNVPTSTETGFITSPVIMETTTKKRRKKARKAYTSWLEFRDEEYQTDEYEDDISNTLRRKRSTPEQRNPSLDLAEFPSDRTGPIHIGKVVHYPSKVSQPKVLLHGKRQHFDETRSKLQILANANSKENFNSSKSDKWTDIIRRNKQSKRNKVADNFKKTNSPPHVAKANPSARKNKKKNGSASATSSNQLSKMDRIMRMRGLNERNATTVFHVARKVHRGRTKRHLEGSRKSYEEDSVTADLFRTSFNVQWIVKCSCDHDCGITTVSPFELSDDGEVLLRRVHRTAPP